MDPTPNPLAALETDDATMANALIGVGNDLLTSSAAQPSSSHVHNPISTYAHDWTRGGGPGFIRPNTNGALSPLASPLLSPVLSSTDNPMMMQINDEIIDINNDCVDSVGTSESVMENIAVAFGSSNNLQQMIDQNEYEPPTNRQRLRSNSIPVKKSERHLSQSLGSQGMASAAAAVANSSRFSSSDDRFSPGIFSKGASKPKLKPNSSAPALGGFRRTSSSHAGGITYSDSAGSLQSEDTAGTISPPMFVDGVIPVGVGWGQGVTGTKHDAMGGNSMRMNGSTNASGGEVTSFDTTTTSTTTKKIASVKPKSADKLQRRLERNRESARESRRRRKHYLEELEGHVSGLSEEMDRGRMAHASVAVRTLREMRIAVLDDAVEQLLLNKNHTPPDKAANALVTHLSRTSTELQVVQTFMRQHLLSLVQPPSNRFVFWLSLQDDGFYRGGRNASERLSAARIGERVSNGGFANAYFSLVHALE